MTSTELAILFVALLFGFGSWVWLTWRYDLKSVNFRQESIPAVAGLAFMLGGEFFYACESLWHFRAGMGPGVTIVYFLIVLGFGGLGLFDDLRGDRSVGGFRGHLSALRRGRLTTGGVKVLGGGALSLVAGFLLTAAYPWPGLPVVLGRGVLAALLIALSANTLNLLDLRPGRCLFGFFVGTALLLAVLAHNRHLFNAFPFWPALAFALVLYPLDAGGRVMLGDTGSNLFGAILGLGAISFLPLWGQALIVALLVGFQWWCESHSLSKTIENTPWLRRLDSKIGVR